MSRGIGEQTLFAREPKVEKGRGSSRVVLKRISILSYVKKREIVYFVMLLCKVGGVLGHILTNDCTNGVVVITVSLH